MIKSFYFYKEDNNRWYVDIPEWEGDIEDLQMVAGADAFLEILAQGENEVWGTLADEEFPGADKLLFLRLGDLESWEYGTGSWYKLESYNGIQYNLEMWLCDVTKHNQVFGCFPKIIYFKKN